MFFDAMHDSIGSTPLIRLRLDAPPGVEVCAKLEMHNPFAMKDRVARHMLLEARRLGVLLPGAPVIESSSGTMALGIALVGRSLGHPVHIVTDPRIDPITLAKLRALGCEVHVVDRMSSHGWQSARLERLEQLRADLPGAFWPQQYSNPDNPGAYRALAQELVTDLGTVDVLVGAVGSGGSLCGTARALRRHNPDLYVVGVDCVGSALFAQPDRPGRLQSGLGNSLQPANLDASLLDEVHWLNDHEAFAATHDLAREQQIFAGNTSGSVYQVLRHLAAHGEPGRRIVGIFPDRGDRYADTVYSQDHWDEHRLSDLELAPRPREVVYGTEVHSWSRASLHEVRPVRRTLLFVESNTTGTGMAALRLARELDFTPVLLTGEPGRYTGLDDTGAEVVVCDTNSLPALREAVQTRFRAQEIAGITTTSDFYVPTVAELATWLGAPGNPAEAMRTCRDKAKLRETLARAGVRQPRFVVVRDAAAGVTAAAKVGLPCVVKPVDDSGSTNVLRCTSAEEVSAHVTHILARTVNARGLPTAGAVLVEELADGPEYSVEMFSVEGRHHCVGITAKSVTGTPYFVEHQHLFPAPVPPAVAEELARTARAALTAAGVRSGPTHTELRLVADGPVIIEVNPRLAGGMIPEMIRLATGTGLLEQQVRAATGQEPLLEPEFARQGGIRFLIAERAGRVLAIEGADRAAAVAGVDRVTVTVRPGAEVRPAQDAYGRLGYIIATSERPEEIEDVLDAAEREIRFVYEEFAHEDAQQPTRAGNR
ncbi:MULTISPECIES: pyridoxal-phosphate dependent enzyme [Streptomyces]|uniref:pyridoxal-phosphate dependent enzyme n=1 Tax=Streptomyces TaxID=1883 RepID=UPI000F54F51F|nr:MULTISPECIES: pyridoxal-phosphate dependent enzyme [Streptomyces]RPK32677.1 putative siderophore biosynthesis protein SbnA [Streptomyces sp. ADI91-18]WBY23734.1 pyridoxal-phosphate dependent enzyme [Streptomyces goshikiensis]